MTRPRRHKSTAAKSFTICRHCRLLVRILVTASTYILLDFFVISTSPWLFFSVDKTFTFFFLIIKSASLLILEYAGV